jgi:hypothetical protein
VTLCSNKILTVSLTTLFHGYFGTVLPNEPFLVSTRLSPGDPLRDPCLARQSSSRQRATISKVKEESESDVRQAERGSAAAGFYHDPPLWIGTVPVDFSAKVPIVDGAQLRKSAFCKTLKNGIELKVTVEGLFAFDFTHWPRAAFIPSPPDRTKPFDGMPPFEELAATVLERTLVMNAFLAFMYTRELHSAKFAREIMIVTPEALISMTDIDTISGFGSIRIGQLYLLASQAQGSQDNQYLYFDERIMTRHGIATEIIEMAADDLAHLMKTYPEDGVLVADLMLRAGKAGQDHNYSAALITYWAVAEKMLQELWQKYRSYNRKDSDKSSRGRRNYTAASISQNLSHAGYLQAELYDQISYVRGKRNQWMHSLGGKISNEDAAKAGDVAAKLLQDARGINLTRTMWGSMRIMI